MFFAQDIPMPAVPGYPQATFLFLLAGGLAFLLWCCNSMVGIYASLRRQPSADVQFATKAELNQLRGEMKADMGSLGGKLDALTTSINHSTAMILRDIGRVEGGQKVLNDLAEAMKSR